MSNLNRGVEDSQNDDPHALNEIQLQFQSQNYERSQMPNIGYFETQSRTASRYTSVLL